jgi:hypothetical protein
MRGQQQREALGQRLVERQLLGRADIVMQQQQGGAAAGGT